MENFDSQSSTWLDEKKTFVAFEVALLEVIPYNVRSTCFAAVVLGSTDLFDVRKYTVLKR